MKEEEVRKNVRKGYAKIAEKGLCCGSSAPCCSDATACEEMGRRMGYTEEELKSVPEGSNLGLGCGNPVALASLREGDFSANSTDIGFPISIPTFLSPDSPFSLAISATIP